MVRTHALMIKLSLVASLLLAAALTGCGSSSAGKKSISVSITPNANPVIVGVNLSQQFTATVSGTSDQTVTWTVSGGSCTGTACGTISAAGVYVAPASVPSPHATVSIIATSQADKSQTRTINVRIVDITITLLPSSATVALNGTQQFTAQTTPSSTVTWSIPAGQLGCVGTACGTISGAGLYIPPAALPAPPIVTVTATSSAEPTSSASSTITLVPSGNSRIKGNFAFHFSGFDGGGPVYSAGTFFSDGMGNISAGDEVVNRSTGPQNLGFTGTYTIGSDNRGTMILNVNGGGTSTYDVAIGSSGEAVFIEADLTGTRGSGVLDKADSTAFFNAKIAGPFVMGLAGTDAAGKPVAAAATLTTDGAAAPNGMVTLGAMDINDAGTHGSSPTLSGTYAVAPNGHGTMMITVPTIGTFNFDFYVVAVGELFIVSDDAVGTNPRWGGLVLGQAVAGFSNSTFSGNSVFNLTGLNSSTGSITAAGILATDGAGNLASGSVFDENNGGAIVSQQALAGTYSVNSNGSGTISFTSAGSPATSFALYAVTSNKAFLLDTSSSNVLSGFLDPQVVGNSGSFTPASIQGSFVTGTTASSSSGATNLSGILSLDGTASITGIQDQSTPSGNSSGQSFAASYTVASNGRGTLTVASPSAASRVLYVINGSKFVTIDIDSGNASSTVIESER